MRTRILYRCRKRDNIGGVAINNYCDWFQIKRKSLTKKCCRNCKFFTNEQIHKDKQKSTPKNKTSPEIESETEKKKEK